MAAIIANPGEDTPRLALADWLDDYGDEHNQARAKFIRLQIETARLPDGDKQSKKKLEQRAQRILTKHREAWIAPLAQLAILYLDTTAHRTARWSRGLLAQLDIPTQTFLLKAAQQALPEVFAQLGVETIEFFGTTKRVTAVTDSPALRWVSGVIWGECDDKALNAFGRSPTCDHLSSIEFTDSKVTDTGLREFAASATTNRLRRFALPLGGTLQPRRKYTAAGVVAILESQRFPLLDTLDLGGIQQAKFSYDALLTSPQLKRLVRLKAGGNVPVSLLVASPHLTALRELSVEDSQIDDQDVDMLLANPALKQLQRLRFWEANAGAQRLSREAEQKLRGRFGKNFRIDYSYQCL